MKKYLSFIITFLMLSCASVQTKKLDDSKSTTDGFYYALPKNNVILEFEIKKTVLTNGKESKYAKCFNLDTLEKTKTSHSIGKILIKPKTYLDKDHIYQLKVNQKFMNKTQFEIEYTKNGELSSSSQSNEDQIIPFITTLAEAASSLSSPLSMQSETIVVNDKEFKCDKAYIKNDRETLSTLQTTTFNLLEARVSLTKEDLDKRLSKLNEIKQSILSKYTVKKTVSIKKVSFEISPERLKNEGIISLFKIDGDKGLERLYLKDWDNRQIDKSIVFAGSSLGSSSKVISVKFGHLEEVVDKIETDSSSSKAGFYYRIPRNSEIMVSLDNKVIYSKTLPIPQLGIVAAAPGNLNNLSFKLHPGLGSIYTLTAKSDSVSITELDELRKSLIKNKDDKTIESLEKELKIKELKKAIENIESSTSEVDSEESN